MLPNFLIIGVQKGATTWLANNLGEHPDVFIVEQKEIHFFHSRFEKGLAWYESHFNDWAGQTSVGEATPGYIYYPDVPAKIQATLGNEIKLIASLRHPVDRAYSAFWMFLSRGIIPADADFRALFCQDVHGFKNRGYYFAQLSRYFEYFPCENFLILIYEKMKQDNNKALEQCWEFLGVDSQFVPNALNTTANKRIDMSIFHYQIWGSHRAMKELLPRNVGKPLASLGRHVFNWLPKKKGYEPLAEELRQELFNDFMSDVKRLEDLLDRDLSIWYAPSHV